MKWNREQYPLTLHNALWVCSWVFAVPLAVLMNVLRELANVVADGVTVASEWLSYHWIKPRSIHYNKQEKSNQSEDDGRN